eukprot:1159456-Pelagomonas_calceolata.AAC.1
MTCRPSSHGYTLGRLCLRGHCSAAATTRHVVEVMSNIIMCVAKCAPNACAEKHICIVYQLSAQQELKLFPLEQRAGPVIKNVCLSLIDIGRPEHQLSAAKQQYANLCSLISAKAKTIHPILLGEGDTRCLGPRYPLFLN